MIESVMKLWIGSSFSAPKKYLAKNGVEFAKEQYCNMSQNLNTDLHHTIAEGPQQYGNFERDHAIVDRCIENVLEYDPKTQLYLHLY